VLLVEQHVRRVLHYVDRVYLLRRGEIEMQGTAAEFAARMGDIEASYLSGAGGEGEEPPFPLPEQPASNGSHP